MTGGDVVTLLGALFGALALLSSTALAARASRRVAIETREARGLRESQSRDIERVKVESEAYGRAQLINDQIVAALREEISRLNSEIAQLRGQLITSSEQAAGLNEKVAVLRHQVDVMRLLLTQHNVPLPPTVDA